MSEMLEGKLDGAKVERDGAMAKLIEIENKNGLNSISAPSEEWKRANTVYNSAQHAMDTAQLALDSAEKIVAAMQDKLARLYDEEEGKLKCILY